VESAPCWLLAGPVSFEEVHRKYMQCSAAHMRCGGLTSALHVGAGQVRQGVRAACSVRTLPLTRGK
jgi:hypothetical protein